MSSVEELVQVDENEEQIEVQAEEPKKRSRGRPRKKETSESTIVVKSDPLQPVEKVVLTEQEVTRRRDILVSVAVLGQLKYYVGEDIPPAKIRTMKVDRLNSLFTVYQTKLGQELTFDMMGGVVSAAVKGLSFLMSFDDNEALKQDLLKNKGLKQILGQQTAEASEKYGDFVAFGNIFLDIFKHIKFSANETPPPNETMQADASTVQTDEKKEN